MAELESALKAMVERPDSEPPPLQELERRVARRRRRRGVWRAVGLAALLLVVAATVPLLAADHRPTVVHTGPATTVRDPTTVTQAYQPERIDLPLPDGWQTLAAQERGSLAIGTRKLTDRDLTLARLARGDAAFQDFPADGVVFVVGHDPLEAKYRGGSEMAGPGPAFALGDAKTLSGGVRVRRGEIPQSSWILAAYLGRDAPDADIRQAESLAATVLLIPAKGVGPPPPPGSRPGFDAGPVPVADDRLRAVATMSAGGYHLTLRVGDGCAVVTTSNGSADSRIGGACPVGPAPDAVAVVGSPIGVPTLPPPSNSSGSVYTDPTTAVIFRTGPSVTAVRATLADGRVVDAKLGAGGWGLAATEGRIFWLEAYDAAGNLVGHAAA